MRKRALLASIVSATVLLAACDDEKKSVPPATRPSAGSGTATTAVTSAAPKPSATQPATTASGATALTDAGPSATAPVQQACASVAAAACAKMFACVPSIKAEFATEIICKDRMQLTCLHAMTAPDVATTTDEMAACAKKLTAATCENFDLEAVAECRLKGKRAAGAACGDDAQCESSHCDNQSPADRCGKCLATVKEGESCQAARCSAGVICAASGKCAKPVAEGGACDAAKPCDRASCVGGKCVAFAKLGEACDPEHKKAPDCHRTVAECDAKTFKCVPESVYDKKPGEACMSVAGGTDVGCIGGFCGVDKKCVAQAADGADCKGHDDCLIPASCIRGKCGIADPASCK